MHVRSQTQLLPLPTFGGPSYDATQSAAMVVESSLDQQRTGYLVKVSIMYVMLMVDLAANSIADHTPASDSVGPIAWAAYVNVSRQSHVVGNRN